jgi:cell fate (sporulation/competence/biofilm development) regulator YmcA (YheA/YmcA/DUF963 family)
MARQVHHPTIDHMVYFYIDLYYTRVAEDPRRRSTLDEHIKEVNYIDELYKNCLKKAHNAKKFDYEENKSKLLDKLEVLTQVLAKQEAASKKSKARKELVEKYMH